MPDVDKENLGFSQGVPEMPEQDEDVIQASKEKLRSLQSELLINTDIDKALLQAERNGYSDSAGEEVLASYLPKNVDATQVEAGESPANTEIEDPSEAIVRLREFADSITETDSPALRLPTAPELLEDTLESLGPWQRLSRIFSDFFDRIKIMLGIQDEVDDYDYNDSDDTSSYNERIEISDISTTGFEDLDDQIASNPNLSFLIYGPQQQRLSYILTQAVRHMDGRSGSRYDGYRLTGYNFDAHKGTEAHPSGPRSCARFVSDTLGMRDESGETARIPAVMSLLPELVARNLSVTGNTGVLFGYENFTRGAVVAWRGNENYGEGRYGHVETVFNNSFFIDGVEYIAFLHNTDSIKMDIRPVHASDNRSRRHARSVFENPELRNQNPALVEIYNRMQDYPENIRFRNNNDSAQSESNSHAFAVDTSNIVGV